MSMKGILKGTKRDVCIKTLCSLLLAKDRPIATGGRMGEILRICSIFPKKLVKYMYSNINSSVKWSVITAGDHISSLTHEDFRTLPLSGALSCSKIFELDDFVSVKSPNSSVSVEGTWDDKSNYLKVHLVGPTSLAAYVQDTGTKLLKKADSRFCRIIIIPKDDKDAERRGAIESHYIHLDENEREQLLEKATTTKTKRDIIVHSAGKNSLTKAAQSRFRMTPKQHVKMFTRDWQKWEHTIEEQTIVPGEFCALKGAYWRWAFGKSPRPNESSYPLVDAVTKASLIAVQSAEASASIVRKMAVLSGPRRDAL